MRTIKASEVVKGMRVRVEQPWGPETTRTVEGPIRRVEDRAPHFRFLTIGNGDLTVGPEDPVTVLAEPEPEWVEGAWYWTQVRHKAGRTLRKRGEDGWLCAGEDDHDFRFNDAAITVLGRVLIVDWPGDDVAEVIEDGNPPRTEPTDMTADDYAAQIIADAIRTQGGAR